MMRIEKIKIRNFFSIQELEVDFTKLKGITPIEGLNIDEKGSNGSGKSLLAEAVTWGLTGGTVRKSTVESMVNFNRPKQCSVEVYLEDGFYISRARKPTFLTFKKGDVNLTKESVKETQKLIEDTLKLNYKTLLATSVFGQHSETTFLEATPETKREIIRSYLNLDEIFYYRGIAKDKKNEARQEQKLIQAAIDAETETLDDYRYKLEKAVDFKIPKELLSLDLQSILNQEKEVRELGKKYVAEEEELDFLHLELKAYRKMAKKKPKDELEICPTCGSESYRVIVTEEDVSNYKANLEDAEKEYNSLELIHEETAEAIKKAQPPISSEKYLDLQEQSAELKDAEFYKREVIKFEKKIEERSQLQKTWEKKFNVMKFWEKVFSESGIVRYFTQIILETLNKAINHYLSLVTEDRFSLILDDTFNETIYSMNREVKYIALSGGEKRRINLAVMLGLQTLSKISNYEEINMIFFDEIGENLDEQGLKGLYILLQELERNTDKVIFIITHNDYLKECLDSHKKITMVKQSGNTTLRI